MGAGSAIQGYTSLVFWRGFTAFFDPIVETFGWSRAATAGALSIQRSEGGMKSPLNENDKITFSLCDISNSLSFCNCL